jgi:MSHA biogenesis protein MshO
MSARFLFRHEFTAARRRARGFTLTEAILVIVITGILASMVAVFIQRPVQAFFDSARRAALVDAADTALRRFSRDLRDALPNSVRVTGTAVEFLHVRSAGRYRQELPYGGSGDLLDFSAADTSFDVLGPTVEVQSGDSIVVYNLGLPSIATAYDDPASASSTRRVAAAPFGAALAKVTMTSSLAFPGSSPAKRFQVVDTPVSYFCAGTQLRRYSGYTITSTQVAPAVGSGDLIADKIATGGCTFTYAAGASQREALVTIRLNLTDGVESVALLYQVHVNNAP